LSWSFQNLNTQQTYNEITELEKRGWKRVWAAEKMRKGRKMGTVAFVSNRERVKKGVLHK